MRTLRCRLMLMGGLAVTASIVAAAEPPPEMARRALERMPALSDSAYVVARGVVVRAGKAVVPWLNERARDGGRLGECASECLLYITRPDDVAAWDEALADGKTASAGIPVPYLAGRLQEFVSYARSSGGGRAEHVALTLAAKGDPAAAGVFSRHLNVRGVCDDCAAGLLALGADALPTLRETVAAGITWLTTERPASQAAERRRLAASGVSGTELERKAASVTWERDYPTQVQSGYAARLLGQLGDREAGSLLRRLLELENVECGYGAAFGLVALGGDENLGAVADALGRDARAFLDVPERRDADKVSPHYRYLRDALLLAGEDAVPVLRVRLVGAEWWQAVWIEGVLASIATSTRRVLRSSEHCCSHVTSPAPPGAARDGRPSDFVAAKPPAVVLEALMSGIELPRPLLVLEEKEDPWARTDWRNLPHAGAVLSSLVERPGIPASDDAAARAAERSEPELVDALRRSVLGGSREAWQRRKHLEILVRMRGAEAHAALREIRDATAARDNDPPHDRHALAALGVQLHEAPAVELLPALRHKSAGVREAAGRAIAVAADADLRDAVAKLLVDPDTDIRGGAARCLLLAGDGRGVPIQIERAVGALRRHEANLSYREDVAPIVAAGEAALSALEGLTGSSDLWTRVAASACHLRVAHPELAARYERALRSRWSALSSQHVIREEDVARQGESLAEAIGADARLLLEESALFDHSSMDVHALGKLADERSIPVLVQSYRAGATAVSRALSRIGEAGLAAARQVPQPDPTKAGFSARSARAGAAARTLFNVGDPAAVPRLIEGLERTRVDLDAYLVQVRTLLVAANPPIDGDGSWTRHPADWRPDERLLEPLLVALADERLHDMHAAVVHALSRFRDLRLVPIGRAWTKRESESASGNAGLWLLAAQRSPFDRLATLRDLLDDEDPGIRGVAAEAYAHSSDWASLPPKRRADTIDRLLDLLGDMAHAFTTSGGDAVQVRDAAWSSLAWIAKHETIDEKEQARILPALAQALADGRVCFWSHLNAPEVFAGWADASAGEQILTGYRRTGNALLGETLARLPYPPALPDLAQHLNEARIVRALHHLGEASVLSLIDVLTAEGEPEQRRSLREHALKGLGELGAVATPAWQAISALLNAPDLRKRAAATLVAIDRERARPLIEAIVVDPSFSDDLASDLARLLMATP